MLSLIQLAVAAALGAVIVAVALAPNRNSAARFTGVILALALLLIGTFYFWKAAIIALAIATVCSLVGGMRFQKSYILRPWEERLGLSCCCFCFLGSRF